MRRIHGFSGPDIVASWSEPNSEGDFRDIDAPRNAPAKNPVAHLDRVAFHSDFFLYEKAIDQIVTVSHPSVPARTTSFTNGGQIFRIYGNRVSAIRHLLDHDLGYTPLVMIAFAGAMLVCGTVVQRTSAGARFVSVYADEEGVGLGEAAYSAASSLPAISLSYRIVVFRTPAPDPEKYQFSGNSDHFQIGRGVIDSDKSYLRRVEPSESDLDMDFGRTIDIKNGGVRVVTGGSVQTDTYYNGSFSGGGFLPVDV